MGAVRSMSFFDGLRMSGPVLEEGNNFSKAIKLTEKDDSSVSLVYCFFRFLARSGMMSVLKFPVFA